MTDERWKHLMNDDKARLTPEERAEGWHFCHEFDGLLVGPGMRETEFCSDTCGKPNPT